MPPQTWTKRFPITWRDKNGNLDLPTPKEFKEYMLGEGYPIARVTQFIEVVDRMRIFPGTWPRRWKWEWPKPDNSAYWILEKFSRPGTPADYYEHRDKSQNMVSWVIDEKLASKTFPGTRFYKFVRAVQSHGLEIDPASLDSVAAVVTFKPMLMIRSRMAGYTEQVVVTVTKSEIRIGKDARGYTAVRITSVKDAHAFLKEALGSRGAKDYSVVYARPPQRVDDPFYNTADFTLVYTHSADDFNPYGDGTPAEESEISPIAIYSEDAADFISDNLCPAQILHRPTKKAITAVKAYLDIIRDKNANSAHYDFPAYAASTGQRVLTYPCAFVLLAGVLFLSTASASLWPVRMIKMDNGQYTAALSPRWGLYGKHHFIPVWLEALYARKLVAWDMEVTKENSKRLQRVMHARAVEMFPPRGC